tara:strand:- start:6617 stop:7288 length:672 start_codon:yes stop_codon:yes gene_type:complete
MWDQFNELCKWHPEIKIESNKEYLKNIFANLLSEEKKNKIIPKQKNIFKAFEYTSFENLKVIIVGQDPYHGINQGNGLAFSVKKNIEIPPSLKNIFSEINRDLNINNTNGDLTSWAKQGVLLLNSVLTVSQNKAKSHKNFGWENLTNQIISIISKNKKKMIFMLWGNEAKKKIKYINIHNHYILTSSHPSPLAAYRGFLGCGHFSKCNEILINQSKKEINWRT